MKRPLRLGWLLLLLAAGLRAEEQPADTPARSDNWLVEGVTGKTNAGSDAAKSSAAPGDNGQTPSGRAASDPSAKNVVNPLSSYLEGWMSPQDFALLKAKEADANTPGVDAATGQSPGKPTPARTGRTVNPYLVETPPTIPAPAPSKPTQPAASLAAAGVAPAPGKNDPPAAKTPAPPPDVLKAQDDSKYFPQLKRF
jgi:hypothetical protein